MEKLIRLNFTNSAVCELNTERNNFIININQNADATNILYAFILEEPNKELKVLYIGKTSRTFRNRMSGYQRGDGTATNNRVHNGVLEYLKHNKSIFVFCFNDYLGSKLHDLHLDVAAGIENALIEYYADFNHEKEHEPLWNIANNKYNKFKNEAGKALQIENLEAIEKSEEDKVYIDEETAIMSGVYNDFEIELSPTNIKYSNLLISKSNTHFFGDHGTLLKIYIENGNEKTLLKDILIDRKSNKDCIRLYLTTEFKKWVEQNSIKDGDKLKILVYESNQVLIAKA